MTTTEPPAPLLGDPPIPPGHRARAKRKVSVTVDAGLWAAVERLVGEGSVPSASAAVEAGLAVWVANRDLRRGLDESYEDHPDARPTEEEVAAAERLLGYR